MIRAFAFTMMAAAVLVQTAPVMAQDVPAGMAAPQRFTDLPGVRPQDPLNGGARIVCEQKLIDRARGGIVPNRGPRYRTVNVCSRNGGPTFTSPMLPPSTIRQLRGFSY